MEKRNWRNVRKQWVFTQQATYTVYSKQPGCKKGKAWFKMANVKKL